MQSGTPQSERQRYLKRWEALKGERSSWVEHWADILDHIKPRRGRFLDRGQRTNDGQKKHSKVINGTATWASRVLAAGMMAGVTSPARPWFRLTVTEPGLAELGAVKAWLHHVEDRLRQAYLRSNLYKALHTVYVDLSLPGTAAMLVEEDAEDGLRAYTLPIGSYCLANSSRQAVDAVYRETQMTVAQLVEAFGLEKCSLQVQRMHAEGKLDVWQPVLHVVDPNGSFQGERLGPAGKRWTSCWFEINAGEEAGMLRRGGYNEFPLMAPRWETNGEDVYGASPAMDALGDVKALQVLEKRKAQAADKIVDPPMSGPSSLMGQTVSLLPGGLTYVDGMHAGQVLQPAVVVPPMAIAVAGAEILRHEQRIGRAFYADLWLMLSGPSAMEDPQKTAREIAERHEEKMLQLGPVLENLQDELLDPLIDRTFAILLRRGDIPPPPEEIAGRELKVEYISILAQAQRMLATSTLDRLAGFVGNIAAVQPQVLDKIDFDQAVDEYSDALGTPPGVVRSDEDVAALRAARAEQAQQRRQLEMAAGAAQGAATLAKADMAGDNALTRLVGNLTGTAPTPGRGGA